MKVAIKTNVPRVHRRLGQALSIFLVGGMAFCLFVSVLLFFAGRNQPANLVGALLTMFLLGPPALMLLVPPMFLGGYPPWIVNIFGERFLLELVNSLVAGVSLDSKKHDADRSFFSRLHDRRTAFGLLITLCLIAGLLSGFFG